MTFGRRSREARQQSALTAPREPVSLRMMLSMLGVLALTVAAIAISRF